MDEDEWRLLTWVERGQNRARTLTYLYSEDEPRTPTEIADHYSLQRNNVSRALRELRADEQDRPSLVRCINPDAPHSRRYVLTDLGETIAAKLTDLQTD